MTTGHSSRSQLPASDSPATTCSLFNTRPRSERETIVSKQTVLVAIDLPLHQEVAAPLADIAAGSGWSVQLVHVAPLTADEAEMTALDEQLQSVGRLFTDRSVDVVAAVVQGSTIGTILDEADRLDASLIAVLSTTFTNTPWPDLGSVTSSLLKVATRPILVVPVATGPAQPGFVAALDRLVSLIDRSEDDPELAELRASALVQLEGRADEDDEGRASLAQRVRTAVSRFETEHTQLTRAVNDVAYYLSGLGI